MAQYVLWTLCYCNTSPKAHFITRRLCRLRSYQMGWWWWVVQMVYFHNELIIRMIIIMLSLIRTTTLFVVVVVILTRVVEINCNVLLLLCLVTFLWMMVIKLVLVLLVNTVSYSACVTFAHVMMKCNRMLLILNCSSTRGAKIRWLTYQIMIFLLLSTVLTTVTAPNKVVWPLVFVVILV